MSMPQPMLGSSEDFPKSPSRASGVLYTSAPAAKRRSPSAVRLCLDAAGAWRLHSLASVGHMVETTTQDDAPRDTQERHLRAADTKPRSHQNRFCSIWGRGRGKLAIRATSPCIIQTLRERRCAGSETATHLLTTAQRGVHRCGAAAAKNRTSASPPSLRRQKQRGTLLPRRGDHGQERE